jgi:hypothetical protein
MMYIPSHAALGNHPKLRRLARTLAVSRPAAVGHLHYLWWWSQEYAPDGDLSYQRYTAEDIADAAMWEGDAYTFVDALKTSGFVDDEDGRLLLHDWAEYGGKIVQDLAKDRERKRGKGNLPTSTAVPQTSAGVPNTSTGTPPELHRNSGVDKIKREERREEEKRTPTESAAVPPASAHKQMAVVLSETEGYAPDARLTKSEWGRFGTAAKELLALGATADEVRLRAGRYKRAYPDWAYTANALVGRWGTLATEPTAVLANGRASPNGTGQYMTAAEKNDERLRRFMIGESDGQPTAISASVTGRGIPPSN